MEKLSAQNTFCMYFALGRLITNKSEIDFGNGNLGQRSVMASKREDVAKLSWPAIHIYTGFLPPIWYQWNVQDIGDFQSGPISKMHVTADFASWGISASTICYTSSRNREEGERRASSHQTASMLQLRTATAEPQVTAFVQMDNQQHHQRRGGWGWGDNVKFIFLPSCWILPQKQKHNHITTQLLIKTMILTQRICYRDIIYLAFYDTSIN